MRVALLHNSSAGSEDHTDAELTAVLRRAGHEVAHVVSRLSDLTEALQRTPCELVVVAGGDGTVGKAACELAGWQVPLSILPLGTANNTAMALALPRHAKKLAKSWHDATPVPFDLGVLQDGRLASRFSEAVGWGVFAETIAEAKRRPAEQSVRLTLKRDRKIFRSVAESVVPRRYEIEADGRDLSGEYVFVEVMNVPFLGPRLQLSPSSDPGDGQFELVLADPSQRDALVNVAKTGVVDPTALRVERVKRVRVVSEDGVLHRDGRLLRYAPGSRVFDVGVEPGPIAYLR